MAVEQWSSGDEWRLLEPEDEDGSEQEPLGVHLCTAVCGLVPLSLLNTRKINTKIHLLTTSTTSLDGFGSNFLEV